MPAKAELERRRAVEAAKTELANRQNAKQTQTDVQHALGELSREENRESLKNELQPIDLLTGGMSRFWPDIARQAGNAFGEGFMLEHGDQLAAFLNTAPKGVAKVFLDAIGFEAPEPESHYSENLARQDQSDQEFADANPIADPRPYVSRVE